MGKKRLKLCCLIGFLALLLKPAVVNAASLLGDDWEKFFKEKVSISGFVENLSGLSVGGGSKFFNTSNRLDKQRFTIQPEINVDMADWAKFFISWKFAKEIRYSSEVKSRKATVTYPPFPPGQPVKALPNTYYDTFSPVPWEAVLDLSPTDNLKVRLGRQFISWGETDGVRLLDLINPQDLTYSPPAAPNLFNLDETRIPWTGLRTLYTVRPVSNTILEFFAMPGFFEEPKQRVDQIVGSNDTADREVRYGLWSAHPETRQIFLSAAGPRNAFGNMFTSPFFCSGNSPTCVVIPTTSRELPDAGDSWKIGTRVSHTIGKLTFSLGYIWGFDPISTDMVFKLTEKRLVQCPGTTPPIPPRCTQGFLKLTNDRLNIFAGQFNYPVADVLNIPVNTAIRGEIAFLPGKSYNISKFPGADGLKASADPDHPDGTVKKNTLRYALGFDRTTLIPFLHPDDPWRAFSISFQIFQNIILNHEDGIHPFSTADKINTVSTLLTLRIGTGYMGDTILPDVFVAYDPDGYWSANPAISYVPPGNEKLKFSLVGALYGGHDKFKSLGFFSDKNSVFLKMRYQF
jgi:hypothetical protein